MSKFITLMESSQFKGPHPPNEAMSQSANIINPERSETPDSNKGSQDNDSTTSSPRIVKPVLGKLQAKKRLMAFANKYVVPPKIEKSKNKLININKSHSSQFNQSKKKPPDSVKILINEVKEAKSRIESELEIQEKNEAELQRYCATGKTPVKKRSEPKISAIEEIIREESRQRQLITVDNCDSKQNNFEKHSKIGKSERSKHDSRHSNWDQRNSGNENSSRSSSAKDYDNRKSDKRQRHSDERKDSAKNKIKRHKDHHERTDHFHNISSEKESHLSPKNDNKIDKSHDKSRNEAIHKSDCKREKKEDMQIIKYNSWSDFKSKGGQIIERISSENTNEDLSKDLKCKTPQDYNTHLEQMLMLGTHRLERTRAVADGINDNKKEYPPESIRATKKTKGPPIFYSENPIVSLLFVREKLFQLLPPERCSLMREISDATGERIIDEVVKDENVRCWFKKFKNRENETTKDSASSSSVSILPPKSKWDSEEELVVSNTYSLKRDDNEEMEVDPEKFEGSIDCVKPKDSPLDSHMNEASNPEDKNVSNDIVNENDNRCTDKTNLDHDIGEKLVSEYEQFMKIVSNETATIEPSEDRYSPKESVQGTVDESDVTNTPPHNKYITKSDPSITPAVVGPFSDENSSMNYDKNESSTPKKSIIHVGDVSQDAAEIIEKDNKAQSTMELNSEPSDWENIRIKVERIDDNNIQSLHSQKIDGKRGRKKKKKKLSSSESSESSSSDNSSESETERRKKKQKKRRKKKRTRDTSSDSSSSSSDDSSSDNDLRKKKRRRKKKKSKKKYHMKKKQVRRDSTDSDSSSSDLDETMSKRKRRKKESRKHHTTSKQQRSKSRSKSRSYNRSKSIDKKKSRKLRKDKEDIEPKEEISDVINVKQEKSQSPEWQPDVEKSRTDITSREQSPNKKEPVKPINENAKKGEFFNEWNNGPLPIIQDIIKEKKTPTKQEKLTSDKKLEEIKNGNDSGNDEDTIVTTELSHYSSMNTTPKGSAELSTELVSGDDKNELVDAKDVRMNKKLVDVSSKQRSRSTSSSSSSSASSSSSGSNDIKKKSEIGSTRLLMKKLKKYRSKCPASLDFDSLNFPSLTQLDQKVSRSGPSVDDWEVDSMDGVTDFLATMSKQKSSAKRESKKTEKQVRYDHDTDTYIAVEKKSSRDSKKKPPGRVCALRIWEDEEEEGAREAIMLLEEKTKLNVEKNLECWQSENDAFIVAPKNEVKTKKQRKDNESPSSLHESGKDKNVGWIEIIPESTMKPIIELVPPPKTETSRWNDTSPGKLEKPEEELVPVNWEEEADWISDIKSSRVISTEQQIKIDLKKITIDNHNVKTIRDTDKTLYSPSSLASQKSEVANASSDSSSDTTDSSSSSESSDTDAELQHEHHDKSNNSAIISKISVSNISSKGDIEESYAETEAMKKLRMDMFAEFAAHDSRNKIDEFSNDLKISPKKLKDELELEMPTSSLKLIPPQLLTRRTNESIKYLDKRTSFRPSEHYTGSKERLVTSMPTNSLSPRINAEKSSTSVKPLTVSTTSNLPNVVLPTNIKSFDDSRFVTAGAYQLDNTAEREDVHRGFHEIPSRHSRSVSRESKRIFSPRRDREQSRTRSSEDRGSNASYQSGSRGPMRDGDRERGRIDGRNFKELLFDDDRHNLSPFSDRDFREKRRVSPTAWNRPRSRSRSWSRSRSRSPKRRDERLLWDRQKPRVKYMDDRRERFSRSPIRGRLPSVGDRDRGRRRYCEGSIDSDRIRDCERRREQDWSIERNIDKPYDPIEMLRGAYCANKKRENESNERPRWREDDAIAGRANSEISDMMYINRPAPDINIDERTYRRNDSLERDIMEGPIPAVDFDRPRYRSRSRERRNRDADWDRSRESSVSDRFGTRPCRRRRLSEPRSRSLKISPRSRCSPSRKVTRGRYKSRSRSRSWTRSRSRSRTRSRSKSRSHSISRSRSRSRTKSSSSSRSRSRSGRRSMEQIGRPKDKSRHSRSYSPAQHQSRRNEDEQYKRSTSREPGRRIETIVHPTGMNPMPPDCSPSECDVNAAAPTAQFECNYYARNNLTYPPRLETSNLPTGSPKRLSLDDRLELELGIKKHRDTPAGVLPSFNHPEFNPHMLSYPPPPTGTPLLVPKNTPQHGSYNRPPPTVLQVGNVLQVVPGDFTGPATVSAIRHNVPPTVPIETINSNRVVRVGNVLQVVPSTTHDWSGSAPPPTTTSNPFDAKSLNNPLPVPVALSASMAPVGGSTPTILTSPLPINIAGAPSTHIQSTLVPTSTPIVALPKLEPPKAPPIIQPVYNYEAIMEDRQKEKMARKKLREEKRQEKKRRKTEKMRRRAKRLLGRTNRETDAITTETITEEAESNVTPNAILTSLADDEDPEDTVIATLGEADEVTTEIEDDEEEEDEEGNVDEDDEDDEDEDEAEDEGEEDESRFITEQSEQQRDSEGANSIDSLNPECPNEPSTIPTIPLLPVPRKGILISAGLWTERDKNDDIDDAANDSGNAIHTVLSQEYNTESIGDANEERLSKWENDKEKQLGVSKRCQSRKSVQFADGIKPGEGTSPSGCESDMPSPPPPVPASLEDPLHELVRRSRTRKSRKKAKRIKPQKTKKKVKVKIIKLKKARNTPLTSMMMDDLDEIDDRSPPPPPPGSPPPPHLWPSYLAAYSATLRTVDTLSSVPSTNPTLPPPTPLPLLIPPPPLNYTIQPCNKA